MEFVTNLLGWVDTLTPPLIELGFALVAFASAVAALTPTPRDDAIAGKLYRIVEVLALNFGHAKETPPNKQGGRFVPD